MDGFLIFSAIVAASVGAMIAFGVYIFCRGPQTGKGASRSAAIWTVRTLPDTGDPNEPASEKRSPRYWRGVGILLLLAALISLATMLITGEPPHRSSPF